MKRLIAALICLVLIIAGVAAVIVGVAAWSQPAAWIVSGLIAILAASAIAYVVEESTK